MRIAIGSFFQESQSFSPVPGSWDHFGEREMLRGQTLLDERTGTKTELGGAIDVAQERGIELVPLLCAATTASAGPLLQDVFQAIRDEMVTRLGEAGQVDGVFLALHGGVVAVGYEDASGEILRTVRAKIGPDIPLIASLDLHANATEFMAQQATALVGYHTFPHVDLYETGRRGMELLFKIVKGEVHPTPSIRRLPMILPGENGRTTQGPYAEVMQMVVDLEKQPGILDGSAFSVQPWLDVFDIGCSVIVIADGNQALADRQADRIAGEFWKRREEFRVELTPTVDALERALAADRRPYVLSDTADSPSSGAPGDSTFVLGKLLEIQPTKTCLLNIVDPQAVHEMVYAGVGQTLTVRLGAGYAPEFYQPLEVTGYIKLISDGAFTNKGPGFHGVTFHRGCTVVFKIGEIELVVSERPVFQWDPELYRSVGLEPCDAQVVVVKSPTGFRAAYEPFAAEIMVLDAPGVCSPDLPSFPFKHVRRPLHPLDEMQEWR